MSFLRDILEDCHPIFLKMYHYMFHFMSSLSLISAKTLQNWIFTESKRKTSKPYKHHSNVLVVQIVHHMSLCVLWQL